MKRKVTWLLMLILLMTALLSGAVYATGDDRESAGETREESAEPETLPAESAEDPEEALAEAMEKSVFSAEDVIAEGVYIGEINVSGMTAEQAMAAVLAQVEELGKKTLTLTLEGADDVEPIKVAVSELGLRTEGLTNSVMEAVSLGKSGNLIVRYKAEKDLKVSNQKYDLTLAVDENLVKNFVNAETSTLSVEPVDAEITRVSGGFDVTQSKTGIKVNTDATAASILAALANWNHQDVAVAATAEITQPKRTTELLSQIQDVIGSYSTDSSATGGRLQNLQTGVKYTTGVLIMPGESWSMHDALAPFTAENGYTKQVAYMNGGYVDEYGGGICQLATTLYNAALRAEVNISKRSNHSMVVGYTDWGLDATVNDGGSKDLELTNDFDYPIYIEASVGGGYVTYKIWGKETRPSNRSLKFYGVTISRTDPSPNPVITEDPTKPVGYVEVTQASSYPAAVCKAYKEIYIDGVLQEKIELHTDKYRASARKEIHGTMPVETPAAPNTDPNEDPNAQPTDPSTEPTQPSEAPAADPVPVG